MTGMLVIEVHLVQESNHDTNHLSLKKEKEKEKKNGEVGMVEEKSLRGHHVKRKQTRWPLLIKGN